MGKGTEVYKCKYNNESDKKQFTLRINPNLPTTPGSAAVSHFKNAITNANSLLVNNDAIYDKYTGEMYYVKTPAVCTNYIGKPIYRAVNSMGDGNAGLLPAVTNSIIGGTAGLMTDLTNTIKTKAPCKEIAVNSCYEQGLRIAPLGGEFKIHIDANDDDSMDMVNYLKNNPHNHSNDSIPNEYTRKQCDSFENINEYSNYINSIKEFNGPNYIRNIYYSALFIFLFYIFIKLYIKK